LDKGAHQNSGCVRGGLKCIARRVDWVANAHAGFVDAVGKRLAPFGVDIFHSNVHERWREALTDDSFQRLEVSCNVQADAGIVLPLTLQAECESHIGGLWVIHSHFGQRLHYGHSCSNLCLYPLLFQLYAANKASQVRVSVYKLHSQPYSYIGGLCNPLILTLADVE